jgi:hypothetical protein
MLTFIIILLFLKENRFAVNKNPTFAITFSPKKVKIK